MCLQFLFLHTLKLTRLRLHQKKKTTTKHLLRHSMPAGGLHVDGHEPSSVRQARQQLVRETAAKRRKTDLCDSENEKDE